MRVKFHELAVFELNEAVEWYENQSNGLGQRFKHRPQLFLIRR